MKKISWQKKLLIRKLLELFVFESHSSDINTKEIKRNKGTEFGLNLWFRFVIWKIMDLISSLPNSKYEISHWNMIILKFVYISVRFKGVILLKRNSNVWKAISSKHQMMRLLTWNNFRKWFHRRMWVNLWLSVLAYLSFGSFKV